MSVAVHVSLHTKSPDGLSTDEKLYLTAKKLYDVCKRHFCSTYVQGQPCYGQRRDGIKNAPEDGSPLPCDNGRCEIGELRKWACEVMRPYDLERAKKEAEALKDAEENRICKFCAISSKGKQKGEKCWVQCTKKPGDVPCSVMDIDGFTESMNQRLSGQPTPLIQKMKECPDYQQTKE